MTKKTIGPGEALNLFDLQDDMPDDSSLALVKSADMEVIRMVLPKGKEVNEHSVDGQVTVQCLKGKVTFVAGNQVNELTKDDWLYLNRNQPHSMQALADTVLLVTILFTHEE